MSQRIQHFATRWLRIVLSAVCLICAAVAHADAFDPLVLGLKEVTSGAPGPVFGVVSNWAAIVGGDDDTSQPSAFVLARTFANGRVAVLGHDGMLSASGLGLLDNERLMTNIVYWLRGTNGPAIQYTTGHGEWASGLALERSLTNVGFAMTPMSAPITTNKLAAGSVLIVGNAWNDFTASEIDAVQQFVSQGGGLLLAGLGWSRSAYHPGKTMEDYPMTQMAVPYGVRWHPAIISDPTNQTNGIPVFHTFYPNVVAFTPSAAMTTITNAHCTYGTNLPAILETNVSLRTSLVVAHAYLSIPATELPVTDPLRLVVSGFHLSLMQDWPAAYARTAPISQSLYPTTVWLRERAWLTLCASAPLTAERKAVIADSVQLSGLARVVFLEYGLVLVDNCRLATNQLNYLYALLSLIPGELHNLQSVSAVDLLGAPPTTISLYSGLNAVNIFGVAITDGPIENQFPSDVSPGFIRIFCSAAAHEVNHIVDAYTVSWSSSSTLANRRAQLISDAGMKDADYLRGGGAFFTANPQEFFASIANQWFTDSVKTIELGISRFQAGHTNPINQALFFAEIYSCGGPTTYFYTTDMSGNLMRTTVPLQRDLEGRIKGLQIGDTFVSMTLNQTGNVTTVSTSQTSPPDLSISLADQTLVLSWPEIPLGYNLERAASLNSSTWLPVTNVAATLAGKRTVSMMLEPNTRFFRLKSAGTSP